MRLTTLSDRVRKLEPLRKGRVILVDGLSGQIHKDVIPKDFDPSKDLVFWIEDSSADKTG